MKKIARARQGIGLIKKLRSYLPIRTLEQIYKTIVRPHLDYCDIIFHRPQLYSDVNLTLNTNYQMKLLESVQYQAALSITGAWKGSNREKLYDELGWESLHFRRLSRRLVQFYKIINGLCPDYLRSLIPSERAHLYGVRRNNIRQLIPTRTLRFKNSFFPDSINLWNDLGPDLRNTISISAFKNKISKIFRKEEKSIFGISDKLGLKWLFQLRVGLSSLNDHKFRHCFRDTPNGNCACNRELETTTHFLLYCGLYDEPRRFLFGIINPILQNHQLGNVNEYDLTNALLYGFSKLSRAENRLIVNATLTFLHASKRFSQN